jgi:hypothetical protein
MSDLSRMLDDVYAEGEGPTRAPSWSSEEALDAAFATWVPGPTDDAPTTERNVIAGVWNEFGRPAEGDGRSAPVPTSDAWALETAPAAEEVVAAGARWSPSDDDILPVRRGRGPRRRR